MSVLALERVTLAYTRARESPRNATPTPPQNPLLDDVSLRLDAGELVSVWGLARAGRTALLRVIAGIESPDAGRVLFRGTPLKGGELGEGIGWCALPPAGGEEQSALEELLVGQIARGISPRTARKRALEALERVGARGAAPYAVRELGADELTRVAIARALTLDPELLLVDEPTAGVAPDERDSLLGLLRGLADEGLAVLACTGDAAALAGADRALALSHGELRGHAAPRLAEVVELRRASA